MQKYEAIFVISTKQDEESIKATVEKFSTLISENGTLTSVDEWGKRKLAYLINKEAEGYYVLFTFVDICGRNICLRLIVVVI